MNALETEDIESFYRPTRIGKTVRAYKVIEMKEFEMSQGIAWISHLVWNDRVICIVENNGDGGSNKYRWTTNEHAYNFHKLAERLYRDKPQFQGEEEDILIAWLDITTNYSSN